jgi:hypothetical protein
VSAHLCTTFDPLCYRCDLNLDELGTEPPVADRLRSLADAEIEAAKDGTRVQKTAAKAAATAYRLAAEMIEESE